MKSLRMELSGKLIELYNSDAIFRATVDSGGTIEDCLVSLSEERKRVIDEAIDYRSQPVPMILPCIRSSYGIEYEFKECDFINTRSEREELVYELEKADHNLATANKKCDERYRQWSIADRALREYDKRNN